MQSIYAYQDYRKFIKDFYENKKKAHKTFSFQVFAQRAGFRANSYLIDVVNRKKALSKNSVLNVARAMGLKKKETDYFECMVHFTHARTESEKDFYYKRLKELADKKTSETKVGCDQYEFYSTWYHTVIRELAVMGDFNGDFKRLAKRVRPPITAKQARDSVELLVRQGLLEKTASGGYRQTNPILHTGDEIKSFAVYNYQMESLGLARQALAKVPAAERDISTVTAGLSEEGFNLFKREIQDFRRRLLQLAAADQGQDRVYHLNLQLFPASDIPKKEKKNE